ncbi:MAG: hypothetical protein NTZ05_20425 [Chloroflexi bacterium]|nr:hypothetical protein [Chloroflexota bacterium]
MAGAVIDKHTGSESGLVSRTTRSPLARLAATVLTQSIAHSIERAERHTTYRPVRRQRPTTECAA